MASRIRHLGLVPPSPAADPAELGARLATLEAETVALRAEVAALREDVHWLAGLEDDGSEPVEAHGRFFSRGWLAAGWARASLVLASLGLVMIVSVPYLMHLLGPADADPLPAVARLAPRSGEPADAVAPARLSRPSGPKIRTAVARSRARVRQAPARPAVESPLPQDDR